MTDAVYLKARSRLASEPGLYRDWNAMWRRLGGSQRDIGAPWATAAYRVLSEGGAILDAERAAREAARF